MRATGWYWVKYKGEWGIAYWSSPFSDGSDYEWNYKDMLFSDGHFDEIDERRITRRDVDAENAKYELNPKEERKKISDLGDKLFGFI